MNTRSSSWTGRAPRSLNEAFGPHQDYISEQESRDNTVGMAIWVVHALAVVSVVALIAIERYFS